MEKERILFYWVSVIAGFVLLARWIASSRAATPRRAYDFPLYLSEGVGGTVWKYLADGTRTRFITGLRNPLGVATDNANSLYVVEGGRDRVWKFDITTGKGEVVREKLRSPSRVVVDSRGEAYVASDVTGEVIRLRDGKVVSVHTSGSPRAITVDSAGNRYQIEREPNRITRLGFDGQRSDWSTGLDDPQYLAFTRY